MSWTIDPKAHPATSVRVFSYLGGKSEAVRLTDR